MAYCRKCRTRIPDGTVICPYCEAPQQDQSIYLNSSTRSSSHNSEQSFSSGSLIFISIALSILGLMGLIVPPKGLILSIPCFALVIAAIVSIVKRNRNHQEMIENMSRAASKNSPPVTQKPAAPTKTWSFADANSVSARPMNQTTASKPIENEATESKPPENSEAESGKHSCSFDDLAKFLCDYIIEYNAELAAVGDPGIHDTIISFEIGETDDEDEHIKHLKEKVLEAVEIKYDGFWANIIIGSNEDIYVTLTGKWSIQRKYNNLPTWKDVKYDPPAKHIGKNFIINNAAFILDDYYGYDYSDTEDKYFCIYTSPEEGIYWHIYADRTQFDWLLTALKKRDYLEGNIIVKAEYPESTKEGYVALVNLEIDGMGCYEWNKSNYTDF